MYAPSYGFGPGSNSQPFTPNGAPLQAPNPHHLQHQQQQQHQQPGQQQMMYNPQQYAASGPHQAPYGGSPGPGMGPNAGGGMGMGMMQNSGLAHVPAGHVASYQTPYSSSPYGASIPTSSGSNLPPNFMPTTSGAPSFPMNASNMNPQHLQSQRMQPPPQSSTPTQPGQRASPFGGMPQGTPPNTVNTQSQFNTPQPNQTQLQTSNASQQNQGATIVTPQTPNFPPGSQGASNAGVAMATPLSPGSEAREKDRVTLLLEINTQLLLEVIHLQPAADAEKREAAAAPISPDSVDGKEKADKDKSKSTVNTREYFECMRRLQGNLAYLAAIADRSHKPSSQIPAHPAILTVPPIAPRAPKDITSTPATENKKDPAEEKKVEDVDLSANREERIEALKDSYKRLQALFPGVDPNQAQANAAARAQMQARQQAQAQSQQAQGQGGQGQGGEQLAQQKMAADLYRQRMMQQAQQNLQNQQAIQHNQAQGQGQGP